MSEPERDANADQKPDPSAAPVLHVFADPYEALSGPPGLTTINLGPGVTDIMVVGWDEDDKEISVAEVRAFPDLWFRCDRLTENGEILLDQYIRTGVV